MQKDTRSLATASPPGKQTEELFFQAYKKSFFTAVKWNTLESLVYQVFFVAHQIGLFVYCDRSLYGKVGALFSFCYLLITLLIAGLDGGLLPFFKEFIAHKKLFHVLLFQYIKRQIVWISACVIFGSTLLIIFSTHHSIQPYTIFLAGLFIIIEGTKKLLKHILSLAFYNRYTAPLEIVQITMYVSVIWISYFFGIPFSLSLFFLPFIVLSLFSVLFCGYILFLYYQTLDDKAVCALPPSAKKFAKIRISVLINQLSRSLFTSNFLVPLFSLYGGFAQAGVMTFANYLTNACTFFIYKVCIPPSEAFLSHVKNFSFSVHSKAFKVIVSLFITVTCVLGLLLFIQGKYFSLLSGHNELTHLNGTIILFFFFIHVLENSFILYEKFFILREQAGFLALGNLITSLVCIGIIKLYSSFFLVVLLCIFIRFLFFFLLSLIITLSKTAPEATLEKHEQK